MNSLDFNQSVAQIEGWISTYFMPPYDGSAGIGGPIATYWTSSPYMAGPYVMNSYGLIRGLCARAGDDATGEARLRVENLARYYLGSQDPTTGMVVCCWGEDPFVGNCLIQQASMVAALWDLHLHWPQREVAAAAHRGWQTCLNHPAMRPNWTVNNQALRAVEALILGIRARGDVKPAPQEKALLERVGKQVAASQLKADPQTRGAIPQASSDDNLIMHYQGKCLTPLVMLAEALDAPQYLEVAKSLADFVLQNMAASTEGPMLCGQYYPTGALVQGRRLYRLRHFVPFMEPYLRRYRQRRITGWRFIPWPRWIARGLDTARGLYYLGRACGDSRYTSAALSMVQEALQHQTPLGGLRNTRGFFGQDPQAAGGLVWQDAAAIPRWNSYAIQFLHELSAGEALISPIKPQAEAQDDVNLAGGLRLRETVQNLVLCRQSGEMLWRIIKGRRWGEPFRAVAEWAEGGPFSGPKRLYS